MKKHIILTLLLTSFCALRIAAQTETKMFSGRVGENRIEMTLQKTGTDLSGSYVYTRVGKPLALAGKITAAGDFTLTEKSPTGAKTGEFRGKWSREAKADAASLSGEWRNAQGAKPLDFYLSEQMISFTNGAALQRKSFAEANKAKYFAIKAEYPELTGVAPAMAATFNQAAKKPVMDSVADYRKGFLAQTADDLQMFKQMGASNDVEISYDVVRADDDLISIYFSNYSFTGGAHPNTSSYTLNYDLRTGKVLKLADVFKPGANYLKFLSDYATKKLKADLGEEILAEGASANAENFDSWNLTKTGMVLNFDAYQVASYAAGPQEVTIPFAEMKNILNASVVGK